MVPWLGPNDPFPSVEQALDAKSSASGLLAASADLVPEQLIEAYRRGIFPWYCAGQPILWWSPNPRMILKPAQFKITPSFKKTLKQVLRDPRWEIRIDQDFTAVMRACAQTPRRNQAGTWITAEIIEAYSALFRAGNAHSVETWFNGTCVGGLYGIALGRMFFGESMFSHVDNASKIALAALIAHLREQQVKMIDCQQNTAHLASLGGHEITRQAFLAHVHAAVVQPSIPWRLNKTVLARLIARTSAAPASNLIDH